MKKLFLAILLVSCTSQQSAKSAADFCKARALYKLSLSDYLMPQPGSPRARLEAAEDEFCATLAK